MRKIVMKEVNVITCDFCGTELNKDVGGSWSLNIHLNDELESEYGSDFTDVGDWCKNCAMIITNYIKEQLEKTGIVERYAIDHDKGKTLKQYQEIMNHYL